MNGHAHATDGTPIAYQVRGDGCPLLLLAGQANNHTWWDPIRADFHGTHATITMDWRGTGDSGRPRSAYSTPGFADDAIAVLDALGVESADVYGTSMGGRVAQWIAINHPGRVRRLVLGCTSPGGPRAHERTKAVRRTLALPDAAARREALEDMMYSPRWRAAHPGPRTTMGDPTMPPHASRGHLAASDGHDARDALHRVAAPTLILHGSDDVMTPAANAPLLAELIPDARFHVFPGARHAYFEECRPHASDLVADFITI
ncbi:alpha/beta fold hydrolase [Actinokineospora fastidiosa]|uniref:Alpha/beta hydrolase n=1 Tax=Actinokineospora fastidiosa TaxID=1816 RepID=A0A918GST8_9PSEU|nr:alpha/beta fold hydrolase [Actinokineospora fastidiosa]GGS58104.1 alpha/beta hydrolase [Actinokineospora fastidiosa]